MRNLLLVVMLLFLTSSTNTNSNTLEVIEIEVTLPTIIVEADYYEWKLNSLIDEIKSIDIKKIQNIPTELNVDSLIYKELPTLKNKKLRDYQRRNYMAVIKMKPVWDYLLIKYKIPKFISASFWIEETRWGNPYGKLFVEYFNLGGIKCWECKNSYKAKDDCGDKLCEFRKFNSLIEGIDEWAKILLLKRYTKHVDRSKGYKQWIRAYKKGGYWTSKNGVVNRISHVRKLGLNKL